MTERTERFNARNATLRRARAHQHVTPLADPELVKQHHESSVDHEKAIADHNSRQAYCHLDADISVDKKEIDVLLDEIKSKLDEEHLGALLDSAMGNVVQNITATFGIGPLINKEFSDIVNYDRSDYVDSSVRKQMHQFKTTRENDEYTGKPVNDAETDHIFSMKNYHDEHGWCLNAEQRKNFARDADNMAYSDRTTNRSKGSASASDFMKMNHRRRTDDQARVDGRRTRALENRGKKTAEKHRVTVADKAKFIAKEGVDSGVRMGVQQALGLVMRELTLALFEEVKDICRYGFKVEGEGFWKALARRAETIMVRVKEKWRDVLIAFGEGFISGFLSLVMEVIIKGVMGITQKIGRIIKEGISSLCRAIKLLLYPPEGMTLAESAHEATKLLAAGGVVVIGVAGEAVLENTLMSVMGPFAQLVSPVLMGILTGLGTAVAVWVLDQIDLFGVNRAGRREQVFMELDDRLEAALGDVEENASLFFEPLLPKPSS